MEQWPRPNRPPLWKIFTIDFRFSPLVNCTRRPTTPKGPHHHTVKKEEEAAAAAQQYMYIHCQSVGTTSRGEPRGRDVDRKKLPFWCKSHVTGTYKRVPPLRYTTREKKRVGLDFISYQDEISFYRVVRSLAEKLTGWPLPLPHHPTNSDGEMVRNFRVSIWILAR